MDGWVWAGGGATTLENVTIFDDDPELSPYYTSDNETITIDGTTYTDPQAGTY
ncbi:MAG: hypothetical protein ACI8YI_000312 [Paracoccaceae bacterium]|jgi:hypothetical protein